MTDNEIVQQIQTRYAFSRGAKMEMPVGKAIAGFRAASAKKKSDPVVVIDWKTQKGNAKLLNVSTCPLSDIPWGF